MGFRRILKLVILIALLVLAGFLFIPRSYDTNPFIPRAGVEYWHVSTGSVIGFTKIESTSENQASPVIYLHGGPGGMIREEVIKTLRPLSASGHDLYFYDQVGSGHSARLDDIGEYSVERHKADLAEIIEMIPSEKVILIGHSWGCMLAANYIQDHPEKVEQLILEGPGPILPVNRSLAGEVPPDSLHLKQPAFSNAEGNRQAYNLRSKLILRWAYLFNRKLASDREVDDFFTYLNQLLSRSTFCDEKQSVTFKGGTGYYAHIMTVKSFASVEDHRDRLQKAAMPVLILRGQCDNQKWGYTREYLDLLPNSKLVIIEGAGHDLVNGNPERYFELVEGFIAAPPEKEPAQKAN